MLVSSTTLISAIFYKNTAFIGLLTATVVTAAYVLWGPSEKKKRRRRDISPGLENLGNTCFLNAVLQALAPCQGILDWLSRILQKKQMNKSESYLAYTMLKTLKVLTNKTLHDRDTFCPSEVLNALRSRWVIPDDEQDAHELFHALTQTLAEETGHYPKVLSLFDVSALQSPENEYQTPNSAITRSKSLLPVLPRDTDHPFRGHFASQLVCQICSYSYPVKYDLFDSLSLNIPETHWAPLSLEMLLQKFITSETVHNVDCPGCTEKINKITEMDVKPLQSTFLKKLSIGKLPQCLCLHIPRTHWLNNNVPVKRLEKVTFPEYLHMDEFIYMGAGSAGDKDRKNWLFGGKASNINRRNNQLSNKMASSAAVNLLRALNHHSRTTMNEFVVKPITHHALYSNVQTDVNQNGPNPPKFDLSAHTYKLIAVIEHIGDVVSGHFVSYRRCPPTQSGEKHSDKWLFTSDAVVKKVSLAQVMKAEAYMLFYEKV